jgi:hypothetical protein
MRRYFELIRSGVRGSVAARQVSVSLSCGSLWFIDAGQVASIDVPVGPRFLSQDDRIEIADGLARGEPVKGDRGAEEAPGSMPRVVSGRGDRPAGSRRRMRGGHLGRRGVPAVGTAGLSPSCL